MPHRDWSPGRAVPAGGFIDVQASNRAEEETYKHTQTSHIYTHNHIYTHMDSHISIPIH